MPSQNKTPFQKSHALAYGIRVAERDADGTVLSAECLFCVYYGREVRVGAKRARTKNTKYFKCPFRTDLYRQHHSRQHPERWQAYQDADDADKKTFFAVAEQPPVQEKLHKYFGTNQIEKIFFVNAPIVDKIIGEMLWDARDIEGQTHATTMGCFEDVVDDSEALPDGQGLNRYRVVIKNTSQFFLGIDYLRVGLSFREVARAMLHTKERSGLGSIGSFSDSTIARYARIACAVNLQKVYQLLQEAWTFSIVLDVSTHTSTSSLDIRIRLHLNRYGIINVHLLAVPIVERHTAAAIFDTAVKVLDVVSPSWRQTIIGIASDGEKKMTGRVSGVATRFQSVANPGFIRIWSGAHQLDVVLQSAYIKLGREAFYKQLTALISYLPRQETLVADMQSRAPKLPDTRWESMHEVSRWFEQHKIRIDAYIDEKQPACAPSPAWWIYMLVIAEFSSVATETFNKLQGYHNSVSMQRAGLLYLQTHLLRSVGGRGPLSESEATALNNSEWAFSECRRFSASLSKAKQLVMNLGSFATRKLALLDASAFDIIVQDIANLYVSSAAGVAAVVAERDEANEADEVLPPVLPHQLAALSHSQFCVIVATHRERLIAAGWTLTRLDEMEQEHKELVRATAAEPALRAAIGACTDDISFDDGWSVVKGRFELLQCFAGGIATVFPGTVQVESGFSILKAEKDELRTAITDLSLEGVLHSKQFSMLASL